MICRLKRGVLGTGTTRKGVSGARPKRGVLGAGQVKQSGHLPPHIPVLDIYASPPPPTHTHNVGSGTTEKYGIWNLL